MEQINRRNLLRGLLATPAVFSFRSFLNARALSPGSGPITTLNVLFHGPFLLAIYDDHIEASTPEQDDHEYRLWGADPAPAKYPSLSSGTHFVRGLRGATKPPTLDANSSIVINPKLVTGIARTVAHCTIWLPLPKSVVAVCLATVTKHIFKGRDSDEPNKVPNIAFTQALIYDVANAASLAIDDIPGWQPQPNLGHEETANLHFEVLPKDPDVDGKHTRKAFANQVALLRGLQLEIDSNGITDCPTVANLPVGVSAGSVCPPAHLQAQVAGRIDILCNKGLPVHCRAPGLIIQK
jgi:hypothetical protein